MAVVSRELVVINELGLHVRPAGTLVKLANKFKSHISIQRDDDTIDAKSIMGVMMLGASKGTTLQVTAEGEDADEAIASIQTLFETGFGELEASADTAGGQV
jgi:phosphocarrier protein